MQKQIARIPPKKTIPPKMTGPANTNTHYLVAAPRIGDEECVAVAAMENN